MTIRGKLNLGELKGKLGARTSKVITSTGATGQKLDLRDAQVLPQTQPKLPMQSLERLPSASAALPHESNGRMGMGNSGKHIAVANSAPLLKVNNF